MNSRESLVSSIKNGNITRDWIQKLINPLGRTYQLSSSRLSSLRAVLEPQTNEKSILQSVTRWNSAPILTEKYSKTWWEIPNIIPLWYHIVIILFSVTPTKHKKEKKDENFQSPRKIQSINILRRKRTQVNCQFLWWGTIILFSKGARSAKASAETPTRSRRKQIIWTEPTNHESVIVFPSSTLWKAPQFIIQ